jgi:hypothetical protein
MAKHHYLMARGHCPWLLQHSLAQSQAQTWHFRSAGRKKKDSNLSVNQLIISETEGIQFIKVNKAGESNGSCVRGNGRGV